MEHHALTTPAIARPVGHEELSRSITVQPGGRVHLIGTLVGDLHNDGGWVSISGRVLTLAPRRDGDP